MFDNFFKHIDIDPLNVHILDGNAPDLKVECDEYEEKIKAAGGIELFVGNNRFSYCIASMLIKVHYSLEKIIYENGTEAKSTPHPGLKLVI